MEHIRFFLERKFNLKKSTPQIGAPILHDTLTQVGAKLMALGSERPNRRIPAEMRPHRS